MITTTGGALQITMRNDLNEHGLQYTSGKSALLPVLIACTHSTSLGMIQTWNNFCFTTGYIEVAITFPGPNSEAHGYVSIFFISAIVSVGRLVIPVSGINSPTFT